MDRKKQLKEEYKQMKPEMGILSIYSAVTGKVYLQATSNLKSRINREVFQLNFGSHPNKKLQQDWSKLGESSFSVEVLDKLTYSKKEGKKDYTEDLAELLSIWREKLMQTGKNLY